MGRFVEEVLPRNEKPVMKWRDKDEALMEVAAGIYDIVGKISRSSGRRLDKASGQARLFYSYAHRDERLRKNLENHLALLRRQGFISEWHDRKIRAGQDWAGEINEKLEEADIVLLLVSADFLASDYCYDKDMKRAMARQEAGEARVIPVIIRDCEWHSAPFGRLQGLPKDCKPVTSWQNRDQAFADIARGIRGVVEELRERKD